MTGMWKQTLTSNNWSNWKHLKTTQKVSEQRTRKVQHQGIRENSLGALYGSLIRDSLSAWVHCKVMSACKGTIN